MRFHKHLRATTYCSARFHGTEVVYELRRHFLSGMETATFHCILNERFAHGSAQNIIFSLSGDISALRACVLSSV